MLGRLDTEIGVGGGDSYQRLELILGLSVIMVETRFEKKQFKEAWRPSLYIDKSCSWERLE